MQTNPQYIDFNTNSFLLHVYIPFVPSASIIPLAQKSVFTVLGGLGILTVKLKQPCLCFQHLLRPLAYVFLT